MKMYYKKSLKIVTLLVTTLLIATASATVYNYLYITSTIGVQGDPIKFTPGADYISAKGTAQGISSDNQTVAFNGMIGVNGTLRTYSDPLRIRNTDPTNSYTVQVRVDGTWTENSNIKYINITIINYSNNETLGRISLVPGGGNTTAFAGSGITMGPNALWRVQWDIFWLSSATSSDTTTVNLRLDASIQ
jgi:signal peptidase I